jgi:Reverse transcriptase (RNA-dependent DNA polymerase)
MTDAITNNSILKGADSSVFPGTSTYESILPLTLFLKVTHCTKRPSHLFLEDESAAVDSIRYNWLSLALTRIITPNAITPLCTNMLQPQRTQVLTAYKPSTPFFPQKGVPQGGIELSLI